MLDRVTIAALVVAGVSVAVSFGVHPRAEVPIRHAFALVIPLAIIVFPGIIEAGFRGSYRGRAHGGEPTPEVFIRVAAWVLLGVIVIVHHAMGFARLPG